MTVKLNLDRTFPFIVLVAGLIGLFASFALTVDKLHVLKDPTFTPSCDINPLFSCGSVMRSPQADVAGIPNTLFGIIGFTAVSTVGAVMLAGARLPKRFWQLFTLGVWTGGMGTVAYLYYQSVYTLKTLCIYCITVWITTVMLAWYTLLWSSDQGHLSGPKRLAGPIRFMRKNHLEILIVIYLIMTALILHRFWYYFGSLL